MDVQEAVLSVVRTKAGQRAGEVNANSRLSEIGLDSPHIVQVVIDIEERCGVELSEDGMTEVMQAASVGDLALAFTKACAELAS